MAALRLHQGYYALQMLISWRHDGDVVGAHTEGQVGIFRRTERSSERFRQLQRNTFDRNRIRVRAFDRQEHHGGLANELGPQAVNRASEQIEERSYLAKA